jgi:NAD(P)H-hydrate epimerase
VGELLAGSGETPANLRIILKMGIPVTVLASARQVERALEECAGSDLLVDALLGTGIRGEVREPYRSAIQAVNRSGLPVLAIDVPSGLDCDTGQPLGEAVRARVTVTMAGGKLGVTRPGADAYTGRVEVAEISIPRAAIERKISDWQSEARPT